MTSESPSHKELTCADMTGSAKRPEERTPPIRVLKRVTSKDLAKEPHTEIPSDRQHDSDRPEPRRRGDRHTSRSGPQRLTHSRPREGRISRRTQRGGGMPFAPEMEHDSDFLPPFLPSPQHPDSGPYGLVPPSFYPPPGFTEHGYPMPGALGRDPVPHFSRRGRNTRGRMDRGGMGHPMDVPYPLPPPISPDVSISPVHRGSLHGSMMRGRRVPYPPSTSEYDAGRVFRARRGMTPGFENSASAPYGEYYALENQEAESNARLEGTPMPYETANAQRRRNRNRYIPSQGDRIHDEMNATNVDEFRDLAMYTSSEFRKQGTGYSEFLESDANHSEFHEKRPLSNSPFLKVHLVPPSPDTISLASHIAGSWLELLPDDVTEPHTRHENKPFAFISSPAKQEIVPTAIEMSTNAQKEMYILDENFLEHQGEMYNDMAHKAVHLEEKVLPHEIRKDDTLEAVYPRVTMQHDDFYHTFIEHGDATLVELWSMGSNESIRSRAMTRVTHHWSLTGLQAPFHWALLTTMHRTKGRSNIQELFTWQLVKKIHQSPCLFFNLEKYKCNRNEDHETQGFHFCLCCGRGDHGAHICPSLNKLERLLRDLGVLLKVSEETLMQFFGLQESEPPPTIVVLLNETAMPLHAHGNTKSQVINNVSSSESVENHRAQPSARTRSCSPASRLTPLNRFRDVFLMKDMDKHPSLSKTRLTASKQDIYQNFVASNLKLRDIWKMGNNSRLRKKAFALLRECPSSMPFFWTLLAAVWTESVVTPFWVKLDYSISETPCFAYNTGNCVNKNVQHIQNKHFCLCCGHSHHDAANCSTMKGLRSAIQQFAHDLGTSVAAVAEIFGTEKINDRFSISVTIAVTKRNADITPSTSKNTISDDSGAGEESDESSFRRNFMLDEVQKVISISRTRFYDVFVTSEDDLRSLWFVTSSDDAQSCAETVMTRHWYKTSFRDVPRLWAILTAAHWVRFLKPHTFNWQRRKHPQGYPCLYFNKADNMCALSERHVPAGFHFCLCCGETDHGARTCRNLKRLEKRLIHFSQQFGLTRDGFDRLLGITGPPSRSVFYIRDLNNTEYSRSRSTSNTAAQKSLAVPAAQGGVDPTLNEVLNTSNGTSEDNSFYAFEHDVVHKQEALDRAYDEERLAFAQHELHRQQYERAQSILKLDEFSNSEDQAHFQILEKSFQISKDSHLRKQQDLESIRRDLSSLEQKRYAESLNDTEEFKTPMVCEAMESFEQSETAHKRTTSDIVDEKANQVSHIHQKQINRHSQEKATSPFSKIHSKSYSDLLHEAFASLLIGLHDHLRLFGNIPYMVFCITVCVFVLLVLYHML